MDISRAERIADIMKTTKQLGKNISKPISPIKIPTVLGQTNSSILPKPVEGTGVIKILMYFVAGLLLIGLILLGVDQWITPIFQRVPGGSGYIPVPGTDMSQVYWETSSTIKNVFIGTPPTPAPTQAGIVDTPPLYTTVIEGQSNYSITMDVFIGDESPQNINADNRRIFFFLGQTLNAPTLYAWIDNTKNTAYITAFTAGGLQDTVILENVPIHTSFRIGIVNTYYALEGYLNGKLVMTRQKKLANKIPATGDTIFSPENIKIQDKVLSQNIKVMNLRLFGYSVSPSEMQGRMGDLISTNTFKPT